MVHRIEGSLYPNWAGESQVARLPWSPGELVLRTPPMRLADGSTVVNELAWRRDKR